MQRMTNVQPLVLKQPQTGRPALYLFRGIFCMCIHTIGPKTVANWWVVHV